MKVGEGEGSPLRVSTFLTPKFEDPEAGALLLDQNPPIYLPQCLKTDYIVHSVITTWYLFVRSFC